jgi:hypothetical protein
MTLTESRMTLIAPAFAENCGILMCSEMSLGGAESAARTCDTCALLIGQWRAIWTGRGKADWIQACQFS